MEYFKVTSPLRRERWYQIQSWRYEFSRVTLQSPTWNVKKEHQAQNTRAHTTQTEEHHQMTQRLQNRWNSFLKNISISKESHYRFETTLGWMWQQIAAQFSISQHVHYFCIATSKDCRIWKQMLGRLDSGQQFVCGVCRRNLLGEFQWRRMSGLYLRTTRRMFPRVHIGWIRHRLLQCRQEIRSWLSIVWDRSFPSRVFQRRPPIFSLLQCTWWWIRISRGKSNSSQLGSTSWATSSFWVIIIIVRSHWCGVFHNGRNCCLYSSTSTMV